MTKNLHCIKCGHDWVPKEEGTKPIRCPNIECRTTKWEGDAPLPGRLPGLSQQEKDNAERTLLKAVKDPQAMPKLNQISAEAVLAANPPKPGSLRERCYQTDPWDYQPMWDMEKRLIQEYKDGLSGTPQWQADFTEWFSFAFIVAIKVIREGRIQKDKDQIRTNLHDKIRRVFGEGLVPLIDSAIYGT